MPENNPLRQYFRQPAIYVKLPSNGKHYPEGTIQLPPGGDLPVYPMTAIDEITYRTPDALFNGQATVNVIESCVPNIKNAWGVPAMDLDTLLVAIRVASYGHDMDFQSTCPGCQHVSEQTIDLRHVLDRMKTPDYSTSLRSGDMEIFFRPMSYQNLNDNNQLQFESQKLMQVLPNTETSDAEKAAALTAGLKRITEITVTALSQSIAAVRTPDALVNEPAFIEELLSNCDKKLFNSIRDHIISLKDQAEMQPLKLTCPECSNQYDQAITLDMSSFFESAS